MTEMDVLEWLEERRSNALRIAESKSGSDLVGWLEDAEYFRKAVALIEGVKAELRERTQTLDILRSQLNDAIKQRDEARSRSGVQSA